MKNHLKKDNNLLEKEYKNQSAGCFGNCRAIAKIN